MFTEVVPQVLLAFFYTVFNHFFWVVLLLVGYLHHRQAKMKQALFGFRDESPWRQTMFSVFFGVVGGLMGSYLLVTLGVSLTEIGIGYLWLVAIGLMLISPRYLCFAYSAGLISICSLVFGFPKVDVPQLMGLVAVLHMVESFLIFVSGHLGAVPIYARNAEGKVVGGFNLQRFWPLPIVALMVISTTNYGGTWFSMPDWWPLIRPNVAGSLDNMIYLMFPVAAALGYADLAITNRPREKSRYSAVVLACYSTALLILAVLASYYRPLGLLAALFSPLAHELTIMVGRNRELKGKPIFVHPPKGVMVLDTFKGSVAEKLGLSSLDIIRTVNGVEVNDKFQLKEAAGIHSWWTEVEYFDGHTGNNQHAFTRKKVGEPLGAILVPGPGDLPNVHFRTKGLLARTWEGLIKKDCSHQQ